MTAAHPLLYGRPAGTRKPRPVEERTADALRSARAHGIVIVDGVRLSHTAGTFTVGSIAGLGEADAAAALAGAWGSGSAR